MRAYPAGWPNVDEPRQTNPKTYLHFIDALWPPATDELPAGWVECATWNTDFDLVGSLLPGQVKAAAGFVQAQGSTTFTRSLSVAPWQHGSQKVTLVDSVELVASYDGPLGLTAYKLGTFRLDPVSGRASDNVLSVKFIDDWISLNRPHTVHTPDGGSADPTDSPFDPAVILKQIATDAGFAYEIPDLGSTLTSIYFPGDRKAKDCLLDLVAANLAVARINSDRKIVVLTYEQLVGGGAVVDTLDVLTKFADLEWVIDPAERFDRVQVTYGVPDYAVDDPSLTVKDLREFAGWVSDTKAKVLPGRVLDFVIDPGAALRLNTDVIGNRAKNGTGAQEDLLKTRNIVSTGRLLMTLQNTSGVTVYRVHTDGEASFLASYWKDISGTDTASTLEWGATEFDSANPLAVDLGKLIQNQADAQLILDRIVSRVSAPGVRLSSVNVVPDLRREIGDLVQVSFPTNGLESKALITSIHNAGTPGSLTQTIDLVLLLPLLSDFDAAWDASTTGPAATLAAFDAFWDAHLPGATLDDFDADPLATN